MAKVLTDNPALFPAQTSPSAGDPRTAGSVETPFQNAADRAAWIRDRLDYLDPSKEGARRLRRFSSVASLKAELIHPDRTFAFVDDGNLYQYSAESTVAELLPVVVAPVDTNGGPGRWIVAAFGSGGINTPNGIPQLNSTGKLATSRLAAGDTSERITASSVRNGLVSFVSTYVADPFDTTSTAMTDVPGAFVTVASAKAGDAIKLSLTLDSGSTTSGFNEFQILVVKPDIVSSAPVAGSIYRGSYTMAGTANAVTVLYAVQADGTHTFRVQHRLVDGAAARTKNVTLIAECYRP